MPTWVKLENFKCPAKDCNDTGGHNWVCGKDKDPTYLNELGIIECQKGTHSGPIVTWGWNCGGSSHNGQYIKADLEGFTFAVSQAMVMAGKVSSDWSITLITNLQKQFPKKN